MPEPKVYPKGFKFFPPRSNAPSFVKGALCVNPNEFFTWLKANPSYLTDYKGDKQITFDILDGKDGLYATVNTYKPQPGAAKTTPAPLPAVDDLPF